MINFQNDHDDSYHEGGGDGGDGGDGGGVGGSLSYAYSRNFP